MELQQQYEPGLVRKLDEDYFKKVEAIEFAVKYDDGRDPRGILKADIVLVGVSRTSKTPLSQYLAHKRLKLRMFLLFLKLIHQKNYLKFLQKNVSA